MNQIFLFIAGIFIAGKHLKNSKGATSSKNDCRKWAFSL